MERDPLSEFIRVVRSVDPDATPRDVADMLWLAEHIKGVSPSWLPIRADRGMPRSPEESEREAVDKAAETPGTANAGASSPAGKKASLHAAAGPAADGETGGISFPAPTLPALPGRANLHRALRPLKCRVDSRVRTTTDIKATANFIAETGIPCPVLRPEKERWLDVFLVVEDSPSMVVWRKTVRELRQVLICSGIFRDVRIWRFARKPDQQVLRLHEGFSGPMPEGSGRHPSALAHPDGRRLILLVSDAVSRAWHEGLVYGMAHHWRKGAVTALVQMMPYWLWERTGLDRAVSVQLSAAGPGDANHHLRIRGPWRVLRALASEEKEKTVSSKRLHLPVVMLSSDFLRPLADSISGRRYHHLPGVLYDEARFSAVPPSPKADSNAADSPRPKPDPESLVRNFRATASHPARRLAAFLAAAPLTLPIMRAVQGVMLPDSRQYHLAEVMLSGMIYRKPSQEKWISSDAVQYGFFDGVREQLLAEARVSETIEVLEVVCGELSAFVDEYTGRKASFRAVLAGGISGEKGALKIADSAFAHVAAFVLRRLGGRYGKIAEKIDQSLKSVISATDTISLSGTGSAWVELPPQQVFISYAKEDFDAAKKIYGDLKSYGLVPWMDRFDILPGEIWDIAIAQAIRQKNCFLALFSSKSKDNQSDIHKEIHEAISVFKKMPDRKILIIPVCIDKCNIVDETFAKFQRVDLFPNYYDGIAKIFDAIQAFRSKLLIGEKYNEIESEIVDQNLVSTSVPNSFESCYQLRKNPLTVSDEEFKKVFRLKEDWRPLEYIENDYHDNRDGTVTDRATGLTWQKSGSSDWLTYKKAKEYVDNLNRDGFAGYTDWRLPTIEELCSLLEPEKKNDNLYIDPIFDKDQWWCWSSDRRVSGGAWYVSFNFGGVLWYVSDSGYVRAVRP